MILSNLPQGTLQFVSNSASQSNISRPKILHNKKKLPKKKFTCAIFVAFNGCPLESSTVPFPPVPSGTYREYSPFPSNLKYRQT
jgi:hypothetical protein